MIAETLTTELYWLTLSIILTGLMWFPYIINRLVEQGVATALWDPQGETKTQAAWADRMMRAHSNAVENLVLFAPLVLMIHVTHLNNELTAMACMIYFFSRLAHYVIFTLGLPAIRIPVFAINFMSLFVLALTLLRVI